MKKTYTKIFKTFLSSKKSLRIVISILSVITIYYFVITSIYLLFLIPIIFMWAMGAEGVEFFNVSSSKEIQRTDISYFTTGDILDSIKLLLIIAILVFAILKLMKIENRLS